MNAFLMIFLLDSMTALLFLVLIVVFAMLVAFATAVVLDYSSRGSSKRKTIFEKEKTEKKEKADALNARF